MKEEDLMLLRYKIIADYPDNYYPVGTIIPLDTFDDIRNEVVWSFDLRKSENFLNKYPHLFKRLEWWEDRLRKDMPEYIKWILGNKVTVVKVDSWTIKDDVVYWWITDKDGNERAIKIEGSDQPATKEEYENQSK